MALGAAVAVTTLSLGSALANAEPALTDLSRPRTLLGPSLPYAPRRTEPGLEIGIAVGREDLMQVGLNYGRHLGTCILVETATCQQYGDLLAFWLLRDAVTLALVMPSLRWHYINFPSRFSNYIRIMGGVGRFATVAETKTLPAVGVGWGMAVYLHPQVDLRFEIRGFAADRAYAMAILGAQIKVDRLLDVFADQMKSLGRTTLESAIKAGGETLRATGEGLEGVVDGVRRTIDDPKEKSKGR